MAILQSLRAFCAKMTQDQFKPQQKWVEDMMRGMAQRNSPLLSEIGRALAEETPEGDPRRLIHTEKRLSRGLNSDRLEDDALQSRYLRHMETYTRREDGEGMVIAVDYTDLSKPYANPERGMEGVCKCWNGSEGVTGLGYPVVQLEADLGDLQLPILLRPFSYEETAKSSQTTLFLEQIQKVAPHIGSRAWWTADRGFDNKVFFDGLDKNSLRWIVRLQVAVKNQRSLFVADGRCLSVEDAAVEAIPRFAIQLPCSRKRKKATGKESIDLQIAARKVYLTDQKKEPSATGPARTLIVIWGFGTKPLCLLISEFLDTKEAILEASRAYGRRWKAEEATRAVKDSRQWGLRLEDVRALTLRGVRRIALLAVLLYGLLATLRDQGGTLLRRILTAAASFGALPPDPRYRLMRGFSELLTRTRRT